MISIPPPFYRQQLGPSDAQAWAEYVNRCLRAVTYDHAFRLTPLFHLPIEHPAVALASLEQLVTQPRFKGVALSADGWEGIDYADPVHNTMWDMLDAAHAITFLHPGKWCDPRLDPLYLENLLGSPYETAVAATQLVMVGVPGRFPNLRFCGPCRRAVPRRRRSAGARVRDEAARPANGRGTAAGRRAPFSCDSIAHHPSALALARDMFGSENVSFGSDWPFPMGRRPGRSAKSSAQDSI